MVAMTTDITQAPIHLGRGSTARPVEDFEWSDEGLAAYDRATRADGADGRMVMMFHMVGAWSVMGAPSGRGGGRDCVHRDSPLRAGTRRGRASRRDLRRPSTDQSTRGVAHRRQRRRRLDRGHHAGPGHRAPPSVTAASRASIGVPTVRTVLRTERIHYEALGVPGCRSATSPSTTGQMTSGPGCC